MFRADPFIVLRNLVASRLFWRRDDGTRRLSSVRVGGSWERQMRVEKTERSCLHSSSWVQSKKKQNKKRGFSTLRLVFNICFHLPLIFPLIFWLLCVPDKSWFKFVFDFKNTVPLHIVSWLSVWCSRPSRTILISMRAGVDTECRWWRWHEDFFPSSVS